MYEKQSVAVACQCGKVVFSAARSPLLAASCYCGSCQRAGQEFENLPSVPPVLDADGGTPIILYRKDRVQCEAGEAYLEEFRLKPDSPTRRVIATCMQFADISGFHERAWLSIYRKRFVDEAPPIEMRIMTKDRRAGVVLEDDVPNYEGYSGRFMLKLILARIAMGFGRSGMGLKNLPRFKGGREN